MNLVIPTLESTPDGGVTVAHWQAHKASLSGENVATAYGTVEFDPDPSTEGYVNYDSLTESNVIAWVQEAIDTVALEASLDANLAEQANPSITVGTPWSGLDYVSSPMTN